MEEKGNYWALSGECVNDPETLEEARERAISECGNGAIRLYKLVDTCLPSLRVWESTTPPAPALDAYSVGDEVEALYNSRPGASNPYEPRATDGDWEMAVISSIPDSGAPIYVCFNGDKASYPMHPYQVRRPVTAAASAPVAVAREFVFGEHCRDKETGLECVVSNYIDQKNESTRTVLFADGIIQYRTDKQLDKIT